MRFEHSADAAQHRFIVICDEDAFCEREWPTRTV